MHSPPVTKRIGELNLDLPDEWLNIIDTDNLRWGGVTGNDCRPTIFYFFRFRRVGGLKMDMERSHKILPASYGDDVALEQS